jgi:ParB family chromosome partitioning protein
VPSSTKISKSSTKLGKGLSALLPTDISDFLLDDEKKALVEHIKLSVIEPNPDQPRKYFEPQQLKELSESIKQHGILQPIIVKKTDHGYVLIAGERRFRAAQLAGLDTIPAIIRTVNKQEQVEIALIENIQRSNLNPIELSEACHRMMETFSIDAEELAVRLKKNVSTLKNILRLEKLPEEAKQAVRDGKVSESQAKTILALTDSQQQIILLGRIMNEKLTVRELEEIARSTNRALASNQGKVLAQANPYLKESRVLRKALAMPTIIRPLAKGGRVIIDFKDLDQLQDLIEKISSLE